MPEPICPLHPTARLLCPACLGSAGGRKMSPKQLLRNRRAARKRRKPKILPPSFRPPWRP